AEKAAAEKAAEEEAKQAAAAKEAADRQRIAEEEAAKQAATKAAAEKAAAAAPPAAERRELTVQAKSAEAKVIREARNTHVAHGPVVKRWVRRAHVRRAAQGQCRDAGRKVFVPGRYVVARGDTLWRIALRHYRNGYFYIRIYRANRGTIHDPARIYPCQTIYLPRKRG
ncbi:MAG TPA: LysM peptidoglycan-binding domain-containing protein, partial [Hyphomicrobium sp.]|nr:LysM peptidoglycan-binding domain-containing protein [Hyphomicrobium sp.]